MIIMNAYVIIFQINDAVITTTSVKLTIRIAPS